MKVIIGGFGNRSMDTATARKPRAKQLRAIGATLHQARQLGGGPATGPALLVAIGVYVAAEVARSYLRDYVELAKAAWWVPFVIAVAASAIMVAKAPHRSWSAKLYDLLSAYDPVDVAAYQHLQALARTHGLQRHDIEEWLANEWEAVSPDEPRQRFANKQTREPQDEKN